MKKQPKTRIVKKSRINSNGHIEDKYTPQVKRWLFWWVIGEYYNFSCAGQARDVIDTYLQLLKVGRKEIIEYPTQEEM